MISAPSFLLPLLTALLLLVSPASRAAEEGRAEPAGLVDKVENEAQIVSGGRANTAVVGARVHMQDELRTGANGRLKVTLRDGTVLTLGEKATVVIDRYVFDPDHGVGEALLTTTAGAFRLVTGRIKQLKGKNIIVSTPVAQLGVPAPNFGVVRSIRLMECSCSMAKSPCRTRWPA